ncbi:acyl-CoA thioesterase [Campylobacter iguaniorum]|uniref:Acyl-CoA thioesterase n=1 Tax=Campylobacter iguaniorum TaxID=1244531 RepID=A0A076FAH1_9BACT|nr:hotdog domain-containing protein [Campylobacter iguaniorum]AII14956.1 acyl-CoA thioesterase [Campylobacter iguaniorum]ALV24784.1 acyl-CoA thioesterase [Campylobacter iguaniorum]
MAENIYDNTDKETPKEDNYQADLKVEQNLNSSFYGKILETKKNYSKTLLKTGNDLRYDEEGLVHSGFIFSAADYAVAVAVNEPFLVTIGSKVSFYAPAKIGDEIEFEAWAYFEESKKREVKVVAKIKDIKVFEASFQVVVLEDHILKIQKKNLEDQATKRESGELKDAL